MAVRRRAGKKSAPKTAAPRKKVAKKRDRALTRSRRDSDNPVPLNKCAICGKEGGTLFYFMEYAPSDEKSRQRIKARLSKNLLPPSGDRCRDCGEAELAHDISELRARDVIARLRTVFEEKGKSTEQVRTIVKKFLSQVSSPTDYSFWKKWNTALIAGWERKLDSIKEDS